MFQFGVRRVGVFPRQANYVLAGREGKPAKSVYKINNLQVDGCVPIK